MRWKEFAADYLHFTRRDRIAIISLALLVIGIFFLPALIPGKAGSKSPVKDTAWITALKKIEQRELNSGQRLNNYDDNSTDYQYDRSPKNYNSKPKGELFNFDPNSLSTEGWQKLGLRDKTIHTIQNYLAKGGQFRKPEDLQRIYGLFPDEFERIAPYIRIETTGGTNGYKDFASNTPKETQPEKKHSPRYSIVDINSADTTQLIALPGIGNKLASRIINFRDKLGGFYSIDQVGETFGVPDSVFQKLKQYLKLENPSIRKININTATIDELKAHPYIRYSLANPIIAYRNQHGPFSNIEDVKKIMVITEQVYQKIQPYLSIN